MFTKEFMRDAIYGDNPDVEIIKDDITDTSRWSEDHSVVFKYGNEYYSTYYRQGLTEQQDEGPWEYDKPDVVEVFPVKKTITVYVTEDELP